MNKILCKMAKEDAKKLIDTIVEVETCGELYNSAIKSIDCVPEALKVILEYYMYTLKIHKAMWTDILVKYIGEDETALKLPILRFDRVKEVIFELEIEGCSLCKN